MSGDPPIDMSPDPTLHAMLLRSVECNELTRQYAPSDPTYVSLDAQGVQLAAQVRALAGKNLHSQATKVAALQKKLEAAGKAAAAALEDLGKTASFIEAVAGAIEKAAGLIKALL